MHHRTGVGERVLWLDLSVGTEVENRLRRPSHGLGHPIVRQRQRATQQTTGSDRAAANVETTDIAKIGHELAHTSMVGRPATSPGQATLTGSFAEAGGNLGMTVASPRMDLW